MLLSTLGATWGEWGSWSVCTESCGGGTRTREQPCDDSDPNDGIDCIGAQPSEEEDCNTGGCRKLAIK